MSDIDTLARTIYGEARSGGKQLMSAVASTILNRVAKQTWYGLTISEVCKKSLQYSCWNENDPNCEVIENVTQSDSVFCDALAVASQAVAGNLKDITDNATHYYSTYISEPSWADGKTPCAYIGNMVFYNNID